jgi:hypothetical protein
MATNPYTKQLLDLKSQARNAHASGTAKVKALWPKCSVKAAHGVVEINAPNAKGGQKTHFHFIGAKAAKAAGIATDTDDFKRNRGLNEELTFCSKAHAAWEKRNS